VISPTLLEIERSIRALSLEEQLWLLERIARQVREKQHITNKFADEISTELAAMANDPDIQAEIALGL
jgi:hypothetical protein